MKKAIVFIFIVIGACSNAYGNSTCTLVKSKEITKNYISTIKQEILDETTEPLTLNCEVTNSDLGYHDDLDSKWLDGYQYDYFQSHIYCGSYNERTEQYKRYLKVVYIEDQGCTVKGHAVY